MASEISITQVRSSIGATRGQLATLRSLKLGRIGRSSQMADTPQLQGMIRTVAHLIEVRGGESR